MARLWPFLIQCMSEGAIFESHGWLLSSERKKPRLSSLSWWHTEKWSVLYYEGVMPSIGHRRQASPNRWLLILLLIMGLESCLRICVLGKLLCVCIFLRVCAFLLPKNSTLGYTCQRNECIFVPKDMWKPSLKMSLSKLKITQTSNNIVFQIIVVNSYKETTMKRTNCYYMEQYECILFTLILKDIVHTIFNLFT